MKHVKKFHHKLHPKQPYIKIYTTQTLVDDFAVYAAEQGRSVSKQGEFLVKQALATEAQSRKLVANGH